MPLVSFQYKAFTLIYFQKKSAVIKILKNTSFLFVNLIAQDIFILRKAMLEK